MTDYVPECIKQLEREGYDRAGRVECRNQYISRDLFGWADVIAIKTSPSLLDMGDDGKQVTTCLRVALVQVTSRSNLSARKRKLVKLLDGLIHDDLFVEAWGYDGRELRKRERYVEGQWISVI